MADRAQRIEAALGSYTECYKLAARMHDELHLNPGETLRETWSTKSRERLAHLMEQLEDREVELHARQAAKVADVRTTAGTFLGFAVAIDEVDDHRYKQIANPYSRTMGTLHKLLEACPRRWAEWEGKQLPPRWRPRLHS